MPFYRMLATVAFAVAILTSSAAAELVITGGPGTSIENAIVIDGASGELEGVAVQYAILDKTFAGWKRESQAVMEKNGRYYDVHNLSRNGKSISVYFDITSFYGKF